MVKKGQVSIEYLIIIGLALLLIIPLTFLFHSNTQEATSQIESTQLLEIATTIISSAESVYYLGEPSKTTLLIQLPDIDNSIVRENEIVFIKDGNEIAISTKIQLAGYLPTSKGNYYIQLESRGEYVWLS